MWGRLSTWFTTWVLNLVHFRCRPLIVAIGTAGETACPTLLDQSLGELGGAGGFACQRKLISIAHPNPENGYAPQVGAPSNRFWGFLQCGADPRSAAGPLAGFLR